MENVDITKFTLVELKSLAYDFIATKENAEANLRTINAEIEKKQREESEKPKYETKMVEEVIVKREEN